MRSVSTTARSSAIVYLLFAVVLLTHVVDGLHVDGVWSTDEVMTVVAKFAFQQTDLMQEKETRGYVYGNVTYDGDTNGNGKSSASSSSSNALLALVNFEHFHRIYAHRSSKTDAYKFCPTALRAASDVAFDARCFPNGKQDFFRKIPCAKGSLCAEEDDAGNVIDGRQLTFQIQDKAQARFWFVVLLNCRLDRECNWTSGLSSENGTTTMTNERRIRYDLWLVNGDPRMKYGNPFEHQFSFDQMDTVEIFLFALTVNLILIALQWRAFVAHRSKRGKFLLAILCAQCVQIACNLTHVAVFAANGRGVRTFKIVGELLEATADFFLLFLLICVAKGWTINKNHVPDRNKLILMSAIYCVLALIFYVWSQNAIDELLDIDVFQTWPGWGSLLLRIVAMACFLVELRRSVRTEYDESKVSFLLHFGAGFLVWFIYLPVLGALSSQVGVMWRYKVVLSIAYLADFVACSVLIHLFWPSSSNRSYFLTNASGLTAGDEMDEYEKAIIMDDLDGIKQVDDSSSTSQSPSTSSRTSRSNGHTSYAA